MHRKTRAVLALVLALSACKSAKRTTVQIEEEPARLASHLAMSDPRAPSQFVDGWYKLESGQWRWTAGHFSVLLRPPVGSAQNGAVLKLNLNIPQAMLDRVKSTSLTATIGGVALPKETYSQPGDYVYARPVPAKLLSGDSVKVEFSLDKFLAAGLVETRELGIIATAVGLEPADAVK